jgi:hypothetical protein
VEEQRRLVEDYCQSLFLTYKAELMSMLIKIDQNDTGDKVSQTLLQFLSGSSQLSAAQPLQKDLTAEYSGQVQDEVGLYPSSNDSSRGLPREPLP